MSEIEGVKRVFVDTNIWLYAFIASQDESKHSIAKQSIQNQNIFLSTQVINETCVNLLRKTNFSEPEIQSLIQAFFNRFFVIKTDQQVQIKASELRQNFQLSFWDSLIVAAALSANCEVLLSEDMQHGLLIDDNLIIQNPFLLNPEATR